MIAHSALAVHPPSSSTMRTTASRIVELAGWLWLVRSVRILVVSVCIQLPTVLVVWMVSITWRGSVCWSVMLGTTLAATTNASCVWNPAGYASLPLNAPPVAPIPKAINFISEYMTMIVGQGSVWASAPSYPTPTRMCASPASRPANSAHHRRSASAVKVVTCWKAVSVLLVVHLACTICLAVARGVLGLV